MISESVHFKRPKKFIFQIIVSDFKMQKRVLKNSFQEPTKYIYMYIHIEKYRSLNRH